MSRDECFNLVFEQMRQAKIKARQNGEDVESINESLNDDELDEYDGDEGNFKPNNANFEGIESSDDEGHETEQSELPEQVV